MTNYKWQNVSLNGHNNNFWHFLKSAQISDSSK